jgi:ABC-type sugar transport system ATPase subunit
MARLMLHQIVKSYGAAEVIKGIDLTVEDGEFVVFVGPSGCGKSTLLRMIAGLEPITGGDMALDGQRVNDQGPVDRGVAMVFQSYALYPHMTVAKNLSYGLRVARMPKDQIKARITAVAKSLQIDHLLDRLPKDLSGGQRQRVAIGRSITREPRIFLFDEPLSNLDAALRVQTRIEIAKLHDRLKTTTIYVTHDQIEAMTLADRIVVLRDGNIAQVGTPLELYHRPQNIFVAGFIGSPKMNLLAVQAAGSTQGAQIMANGQVIQLPIALTRDATVTLGIRPEDMILTPDQSGPLQFVVDVEENLGEFRLLYMNSADGTSITAKLKSDADFRPGDILHFTFDPANAHLFDESEQRLPDLLSPTHTTERRPI